MLERVEEHSRAGRRVAGLEEGGRLRHRAQGRHAATRACQHLLALGAERELDPLPGGVGVRALGHAEAVGVQHAGRLDVGRERRHVPLEACDRAQQGHVAPRRQQHRHAAVEEALVDRLGVGLVGGRRPAVAAQGEQPLEAAAALRRVEQQARRPVLVVDQLAARAPDPRRGADQADVDADAVAALAGERLRRGGEAARSSTTCRAAARPPSGTRRRCSRRPGSRRSAAGTGARRRTRTPSAAAGRSPRARTRPSRRAAARPGSIAPRAARPPMWR